jgi:hypothetical protein
MDYRSARSALDWMVRERNIVANHLAAVHVQINDAAVAAACDASRREKVRRYFRTRGTSYWGRLEEERYQAELAAGRARRAGEIGALVRKLARQDKAIEAHRRRHGINEPI